MPPAPPRHRRPISCPDTSWTSPFAVVEIPGVGDSSSAGLACPDRNATEIREKGERGAMAATGASRSDFRLGDWLVRPSLATIERDAAAVHVTPRSMAVLVYLA